MTVSDNVFVSEQIKHPKWVINRFRKGKIIPGIYVIRLGYPPDSLEIILADYFKQKALADDDRPIVAFAKDHEDAVRYVVDITEKSLDRFGFPDIRRYLNA